MDIQKINQLLDDNDFANELARASSIEDVQKLFCANGVKLSQEEVTELVRIISEMAQMTEGELENVVGGTSSLDYMVNGDIKKTDYVSSNILYRGNHVDFGTLKVPIQLVKTFSTDSYKSNKILSNNYSKKDS